MQISIVGKNFEITPAIKKFTEEKLTVLTTRYPHITQIQVTLHIDHITHIAEGTVHLPGIDLHASAEDTDMYKSIDALSHKLLHQLTKYKDKLIDSHH